MSLQPNAPREVLIVEDEGPIAQVLAFIVEDCGYVPLLAANGKEALHLLTEHHPLLILTDLMMPQMTGAELIQVLRSYDQELPPIIIMSAAGKRFLEKTQADGIINKPFEVAEIEALLHRFLPPA